MTKTSVARLILLPEGLAHQYLVRARPSSRCSVCRRSYRRHGTRSLVMRCNHCGVEFSDVCYLSRVASVRERVALEVATEDEFTRTPYIRLCPGCRS
jgi:ribosomal protein L37AE/L43A